MSKVIEFGADARKQLVDGIDNCKRSRASTKY